ncbi:putative amino-acid-binding protein YxeM [Sinobacterium norvegicum]|uniref:Amino-acid-binding protein YxeM n=1 Tax=Sinobacterium norvegicum TaxID=1641715 RepID=A0ABM9ABG6_9GAMM|nr:amino acid ABC transporter substrate-binding protein [Sinobacterium norvegicum]CAH0990295.1 putative amino-acid-binding protein YxeM [Sinobacterium norvegicum]
MRNIIIGGFVAALLMVAGCTEKSKESADSNVISVGMSGTYFPFTFSKNDELQGFEVDLWRALASEMGKTVEFKQTNFSGLFGMLQAGKIDTISNQITVTDERTEQYYFATPYVYTGAQLVVHKDNNDIHSVDDLCGKKVAVNAGSNFAQLLMALDTEKCINVVTYDIGIEQDVILGRSDAFVMDRTSAVALIEESGHPLKVTGSPFEVIANAFPFAKTEQGAETRDEVNKALAVLRQNGTLTALSMKWFHTDITTADDAQ